MKITTAIPHLLVAALILSGSLAQGQNISADQLTVAESAMLNGYTTFGTLIDTQAGPGFRVNVAQTSTLVEEVIWVPEVTNTFMQWQDIWDWVDQGSMQTEYQNQAYQVWIEPVVDGEGNVITEGYYTWVDNYVPIGTYWVPNIVWAVTGQQQVEVTQTTPGHEDTIQVTRYSVPQLLFTGTRSNAAWIWRNPSDSTSSGMRDLMMLTTGGLSFPAPYENGYLYRSVVGDGQLLLTQTIDTTYDNQRESWGSKSTPDGFQAWWDSGGAMGTDRLDAPAQSLNAKLTQTALQLDRTQTIDGTPQTATTRIVADHAMFGGSVSVKGAIRVLPAGDIDMGIYTNGPQP